MDVSFGTIWEAIARDLPDAVAISEPARDYTFAEFEDRAARLATALAAAGIGPGDKVACYLYNGAPYLETMFAAFKVGAVPVNANYRYTKDELTALLADADAAALVFSGDLAANVVHAVSTLPSLRLLVRHAAIVRRVVFDHRPARVVLLDGRQHILVIHRPELGSLLGSQIHVLRRDLLALGAQVRAQHRDVLVADTGLLPADVRLRRIHRRIL